LAASHDGECVRSATRDDAVEAHKRMVAQVFPALAQAQNVEG
jgi:hypothetical protein